MLVILVIYGLCTVYVVYWSYWFMYCLINIMLCIELIEHLVSPKMGVYLKHPPQTIEIILSCLQIIKLNMFHGNSMATLSRISIRRYLSWKQLRMVNGWKRPWESLKYFQVMCHEVGGSLVKTFQKYVKFCQWLPLPQLVAKNRNPRRVLKVCLSLNLFAYTGARSHKHNQEILIIDFHHRKNKYTNKIQQKMHN